MPGLSDRTVRVGAVTQPWQPDDPHSPFRRPTGAPSAPWAASTQRQWAPPTGRPSYPTQDPYAGAGQGWGAPAMFPVPPRPRRRHPFLRLLRMLFLLSLMGFLALLGLGWWVAGHTGVDVPSSTPTSGATSSAAPTVDTRPSASATPTARPSSSEPAGTYQNDSYVVPAPDTDPPALPEPETYSEAKSLMTANPLYRQSVPRPVRCDMGAINLQTASRAQLTDHLNDMMGCLMRVWEPPLAKAGFTAVRPSVTVYSGSIATKCGKMGGRNASYCGADQQVYYASDLPQVVPASLRGSRFVTESVIAHEFGHAVQARSAILISEQVWEDKSSKSGQLQYSRRLEQQADCMAGEFLGSVQRSTQMTQPEMDAVGTLFHSIGDDSLTGIPGYVGNHGSGAGRQAWITAGMGSTSVGACNTFTAPASKVR